MATTTISVPRKLLDDVTYVLRDGDGHAGPQRELADKIDKLTHIKVATCDTRRTAVDAPHKGVHVCGLAVGHKERHECGRAEGGVACKATWRKLVRASTN